ncbi:hypothetical protein D9M69_460480 [compost metagenome]
MLQRISGGSRDTELKLLAVTPARVPSGAVAVTMVTPVAKLPRARRKARESKTDSWEDMAQLLAATSWDGRAIVRTRAARGRPARR